MDRLDRANEVLGESGLALGRTIGRNAERIDRIGGAVVGGIGKAVGAGTSTVGEGITGGAVALGALGAGTAYVAGRALLPVGLTVGGAVGKVAFEGAKTAGNVAGKTAKFLGTGALASAYNGTGNKFFRKFGNPIGMAAAVIGKVMGGLVKVNKGGQIWDASAKKVITKSPSLSLTKKGGAAILGTSLLSGSVGAFGEAEARTMGTIDSTVTTATPDYQPQEYKTTVNNNMIDNAGATGDLVFALFQNRGRSMF